MSVSAEEVEKHEFTPAEVSFVVVIAASLMASALASRENVLELLQTKE